MSDDQEEEEEEEGDPYMNRYDDGYMSESDDEGFYGEVDFVVTVDNYNKLTLDQLNRLYRPRVGEFATMEYAFYHHPLIRVDEAIIREFIKTMLRKKKFYSVKHFEKYKSNTFDMMYHPLYKGVVCRTAIEDDKYTTPIGVPPNNRMDAPYDWSSLSNYP